MAKILDNITFTTNTPKYVELKYGVLINGQYYLKDNMQPVPFNSISMPNNEMTGGNFLYLDRCVKHTENNQYGAAAVSKNFIIYDSNDDTITYILFENNTHKILVKFKEENNKCTLVSRVTVVNQDYCRVLKMEETDTDILIHMGGESSINYVYKVDKATMTLNGGHNMCSGSGSTSYPYDTVSMPTDNMYVFCGYNAQVLSIWEESLGTYKQINTNANGGTTSSSNRHKFALNNVYFEDDNSLAVFTPVAASGSGNTKISEFKKSTYDKTTKTWTQASCTINYDSSIENQDTYYPVSNVWERDIWFKTIGREDYLIMYERHINSPTTSSVRFFLINDRSGDTTLTFKKLQQMPVGQCGKIIHYKDEDKLRFYGHNNQTAAANSKFSAVYCYELDESRLEFVKTLDIPGDIKEFGFDIDRNLYVLWGDNSLSRYNQNTVANFEAKFKEGLYEYQGIDILTELIISTTNLQGDRLAKSVKLDIKGNAKFTDNGTKTIEVTTSESEDIKVPVTITGAGAINIFPKIKA